MRIGIDISQTAYTGTGVANYLSELVDNLLEIDKKNEYVLFFSSLRKSLDPEFLKHQKNPKVELKSLKFPPSFLEIIWNRLHIFPIERLVGHVDLFISSDWIEPPAERAKKATIIYDLIAFKHPAETDSKIVKTQKRKLKWVNKETDLVFTISESSKKDIQEILKIDSDKIKVIYPGLSI